MRALAIIVSIVSPYDALYLSRSLIACSFWPLVSQKVEKLINASFNGGLPLMLWVKYSSASALRCILAEPIAAYNAARLLPGSCLRLSLA